MKCLCIAVAHRSGLDRGFLIKIGLLNICMNRVDVKERRGPESAHLEQMERGRPGRVIKDFVGRYQTMKGYHVVRKAGWDTHGLPVELGSIGISGKQEIENYGVEAFIKNAKPAYLNMSTSGAS